MFATRQSRDYLVSWFARTENAWPRWRDAIGTFMLGERCFAEIHIIWVEMKSVSSVSINLKLCIRFRLWFLLNRSNHDNSWSIIKSYFSCCPEIKNSFSYFYLGQEKCLVAEELQCGAGEPKYQTPVDIHTHFHIVYGYMKTVILKPRAAVKKWKSSYISIYNASRSMFALIARFSKCDFWNLWKISDRHGKKEN